MPALGDLSPDHRRLVAAAREKCFILYEGTRTPHRSCGIALAETFGLATAPYQSLRRGGLTGTGECGAIMGGRLILGEILGDPDPTGGVTETLRAATNEYERLWRERLDFGDTPTTDANGDPTIVCNVLTASFPEFSGPARKRFCTALAAEVAALCAEVLLRHGAPVVIAAIDGVPDFVPPDA